MMTLLEFFDLFVADDSGATAIEYGLIAALIALAIVTGAQGLGNAINDQLGRVSTKLGTY